MMAKGSDEEYLPVSRVAEELDISAKSVRTLVHRGELPGYRFIGQRITVRREDLEEFKASRRIKPSATREEAS
jgi:excisionase family DNA binding protein